MNRSSRKLAVSAVAFLTAFSASAQDAPFVIQIVEDPRTVRDVQTAPGQSAVQLDLRFASERPAPALSVQAWRHSRTTEFRAWSNYAAFISRSEVVVIDGDTEIATLPIRLGGVARTSQSFPESASYFLRVYDAKGRRDETRGKNIASSGVKSPTIGELLYHSETNDIERQRIRLSGRAVTADGSNLQSGQVAIFEGYTVPVRSDGRFENTQILPAGDRVLDLSVADADGRILTQYSQPVSVADEDFFYVGIADVTVGQNDTSGPIEEITGDDSGRFADEIYVDGRLAFYLRGKIRGDWLLTTAADTREGPIEELFDNFLESDARSFIRRLDPDRYYPIYGDDSTAVNDAPTDGKLFVRLERGGTEFLWGNFRTRAPETTFTNFTRSLYGGRFRIEGGQTSSGDVKYRAELFAAEPGTIQALDEFRGTGGSLYFLRNQDILAGSPQVWIEVRDAVTGSLIVREQLAPLEDFEVNPIQGRIQLRAPLSSTVAAGSLIGGISAGGNPQFLVVRYEHSPGIGAADETVFGGSAEVAVNERLTFGVSGYRQQDGPNDQQLAGITARYHLSDQSSIEVELARSRDVGAPTFQSIDGGFTFTQRPAGAGEEASAGKVALSLDLDDIGLGTGRADLFVQHREAGFSGPGEQSDEAITQYGADITYSLNPRTDLRFILRGKESDSQSSDTFEFDLVRQMSESTKLSFGIVYDDLETRAANASNTLSTTGRRVDAVVRTDFDSGRGWTAYGYAQATLNRTGSRARNDRIGIGGTVEATDRLTFGGEISSGTGGLGAEISGSWQVDERSDVYLTYSMEPDSADNTYRGQTGKFTLGGTRQVNDFVTYLAEQNYYHGDGPTGWVNSFGVDLTPEGNWSFGVRAEAGDISDPLNGDLEREALSFSSAYSDDLKSFASNLEYRVDEGDERREAWGVRGRLAYQTSEDWRFLAKLGAATSSSSDPATSDTEFVELVTGFAYRPVEHDRLNALFRYSFLYDTESEGQVGVGGAPVDVAQRSHVLSADAIYEVNNTLSFGGKIGARLGELRPVGGDWVSSNAYLGVLRVDIQFRPKWDVLAEYRYLATPDVDASRSGGLLALYRRVNDNMRFGVGYNATDFSDDLTDQSYTSDGWFLNIIGKF